ncbi:MAG: divergent polysaccharide deacetylase family protein [bacterium]
MMRPVSRRPAPEIRPPLVLSVIATLLLVVTVAVRFSIPVNLPTSNGPDIVEEPYPDTHIVPPEPLERTDAPRIALVIDDLGNRWDNDIVRGLLTLDIPLTLGVIPGLVYSDRIAKAAHDHGELVIAHVPMKPLHGGVGLGIPVIYPKASRTQVEEALNSALRLPYAKGMNNHMGSAATQDLETMSLVARTCRTNGWFILDSITHASSVLYAVALQEGVPAARRDVFLDHEKGVTSIRAELAKAEQLARAHSRPIVVIGHPRPETWEVLHSEIPGMLARGVRFVPLTKALRTGGGREQAFERTVKP